MQVEVKAIDSYIRIATENHDEAERFANENKKKGRIFSVGAIVTGIALALIFSQPLVAIPFVIFPVVWVCSYNSERNLIVRHTKYLLDTILIHRRALLLIEELITEFGEQKKELLTQYDLISIDKSLTEVFDLYNSSVDFPKSNKKCSLVHELNAEIQFSFKLLKEMREVYDKEDYENKQKTLKVLTEHVQVSISSIKNTIKHQSEIISRMGKPENFKSSNRRHTS